MPKGREVPNQQPHGTPPDRDFAAAAAAYLGAMPPKDAADLLALMFQELERQRRYGARAARHGFADWLRSEAGKYRRQGPPKPRPGQDTKYYERVFRNKELIAAMFDDMAEASYSESPDMDMIVIARYNAKQSEPPPAVKARRYRNTLISLARMILTAAWDRDAALALIRQSLEKPESIDELPAGLFD